MHTRQSYMNGKCTHREYYGQFVTPSILALVKRRIGVEVIKASTDPHFNNIPLCRWDAMDGSVRSHCAKINKTAGAYPTACASLSDSVCTLKEAAQQIRESRS